MDDARIAELLVPFLSGPPGAGHGSEPVVLSPAQLRYISTYIDLLLHWNARTNLTAVREPEEIVPRHFGESIFAARHLFPEAKATEADPSGSVSPKLHVIDVGSGAGFPGLPIKIWAPEVHLTLIESQHKKATFLKEVVRRLKLSNVDVFAGRANAFTGSKGDVVTLRAVEQFESVIPVAAGLVGPVARLALLVGKAQLTLAGKLTPGLQWSKPSRVPLSSSRVLIIGSKEPSSLT